MDDDPILRADCARCAALCCLGLAFDRSEHFAFDKAAGVACPLLGPDQRCGVHAGLRENGLQGCADYDCLGAGQRVTQELFGGRSWRQHPRLAAPMLDAFRALRQVHELLLLLRTARRLPITPRQERRRRRLERALRPPLGWTRETAAAFELGPLPGEVRAFLGTLRGRVAGAGPLRHRLPIVSDGGGRQLEDDTRKASVTPTRRA